MQTIGYTFDEKILDTMELEAFLDVVPPVTAFEVAPDPLLFEKYDFRKILSKVKNHHYHVPYFMAPGKYDFSSEHYKSDYTKFLSIIESLRQYTVKTPSMIVHAGEILTERSKAYNETLKGIDYLLNFIEQKKMDLNLALETLQTPYLGNREELMAILTEFNHPRLSICLDIHHDSMNQNTDMSPSFIEAISYVHIHHHHGSLRNLDNIPLLDKHYNIELLTSGCKNYPETLKEDILYLKTLFNIK